MNYGFIKPTITKEHWVLGGSEMPFIEHQPDGNWFHSLPVKELQNLPFETYNCTSFNTLNQIEIYMLKVFGKKVNYSDRWLGIIAGTRPPGNDPQNVYEAIREHGLIPEEMLPITDDLQSVDEYYSFKGADEAACRAEGKRWLEKYEFFHEWVFGDGYSWEERKNNIHVALKSSPLAIGVYAWSKDDRNVYIPISEENHWTSCYAYTDFEKIFDSYDPVLKDVEQELNFCKRIYIREKVKVSEPRKVTLFERICLRIKSMFDSRTFGALRSPAWASIRKQFLKINPECAVCRSRWAVEAHHIKPFHLFPDLELDVNNLITLCRNHHLWFGHLGKWASINSDIRNWLTKVEQRP